MDQIEKKNRDVQRQNKAATLVSATLFSIVTKEGVAAIELISEKIKNSTDIAFIHKSINAISVINTVISTANDKATKDYCRCSTYVKAGAIPIAHRESQTIKKALLNGGKKYLMNDLRHYNKTVIDMQETILDTIQAINDTNVIEYRAHLSEPIDDQSTNNSSNSSNNNRQLSKRKTTTKSVPNTYSKRYAYV